MYFLLKMLIFHCYVSLPEGKCINIPYMGCHGLFISPPGISRVDTPNFDAIFLKPEIYISENQHLPGSSQKPFWVFQVTISGVKWPSFGWLKGHLEEAGVVSILVIR